MLKRFSATLFSNILLLIFICIYVGINHNEINSLLDGLPYVPVFAMYLFIFYISIKWNKIYIYELICDDNTISIKYLSFNEEKNLIFNKSNVSIVLERVQVTSLFPKFKLILKQDNLSITQYSTGWDNIKIKEIYSNLIDWQKA